MLKTGKVTLKSLEKRSIKGLSKKIETALNGETDGTFEDLFVTSTRCNYGGLRYWWQCPKCGRRVSILYALPWQFKEWACRHCHEAVHESSRAGRYRREYNKATGLYLRYSRKRPDELRPFDFLNMEDKPKGMHWKRWIKIFIKQAVARNEALTFHLRSVNWAHRGCMSHEEIMKEWKRIEEAQRTANQGG
ncbi:hypothetical protein [Thiothrix lacustris]|uniref:hypothetical protein n=1 Tax=Thiothrix lacustris TaxID=525917 RepID=UPI00048AC178|nr:hypothetical protein [Thiothrix lacustris]